MSIIFDCSVPVVNFGFGVGLAPAQADNTVPRMPYTDADLAEYREWLAEREAAEAQERDREDTLAAIREREEARRWEELAELEELAARFDAVCHA